MKKGGIAVLFLFIAGFANPQTPVEKKEKEHKKPKAQTCPCSIWPGTTTPVTADSNETKPLELGVRFMATANGTITGIRFYKGPKNTGTHVGNLWSIDGTRLAAVTFTGETASGWQQMNFSNPVSITANTNYIASYYSPTGDFAVDRPYFATAGVSNPPLAALVDGKVAGSYNGVFTYGTASQFPSSSYQSSNYWVDVVFATGAAVAPPTITTQPISQTIKNGGNVTFSIVATGADRYQWMKNGSTLPNETNPTYTEVATSNESNSKFSCIAYNAGGQATSDTATLTVQTSAPLDAGLSTFTTTAPGYDALLRCSQAVKCVSVVGNAGDPTTLNLIVQTTVTNAVTLTWTASTTVGVSTYNVYRGTVKGGPYQVIAGVNAPTLTFIDRSVLAATTYYYVTTAVDPTQHPSESVYSNEATAVIP